ncbi:MAG: gliding motility-associated C-terminal domain-containing protein [Alphaproteobacteria bacterium]|nr:gliding motility-associated C-terminal domain-containing protein [Alphaproteobacteria bacterium]
MRVFSQPLNLTFINGTSAKYCLNANSVTNLSVNSNSQLGNANIVWYRSFVNAVGSALPIDSVGAGSIFKPRVDTPSKIYYYSVVKILEAPNGCNVSSTGISGAIEVYAQPIVSTINLSSANYCLNQSGGVTDLVVSGSTGGYGTKSIQWYSNSVNSYVGSSAIVNAIDSNFSPIISNVNTRYYFAVIKNGANLGLACDSVRSVISGNIVTNQVPNISSSNIATIRNTYCQGDTTEPFIIIANDGSGGAVNYLWYMNKAAGVRGNLINGANSNMFTPNKDSIGTNYYSVVVSNTNCSISQQSNGISVNKAPVINSQIPKTNYVYCTNDSKTPLSISIIDALGGTNINYEWYISSIDQTSNNNALRLVNTANTITPIDTIARLFYYVIARNGISGNNCAITSNTSGSVAIYRNPIITSSALNAQQYCKASLGSLGNPLNVVVSYGLGTGVVKWYRSSSLVAPRNGNAQDSVGIGLIFNPKIDSTSGFFYYTIISNLSAPMHCSLTSSEYSGSIEVFDTPKISMQPLNVPNVIKYCINQANGVSALNISATNGGYGTPVTFQWYSNSTNSNVGGALINGATNSTFTPSLSSLGATYYYVDVRNGSGLSSCNSIKSAVSSQILINTRPSITNQPIGGGKYCQNSIATTLFIAASGSDKKYVWYESINNTNDKTESLVLRVGEGQNYVPSTATVGIHYYYAIIRDTTLPNECDTSISNYSMPYEVFDTPSVVIINNQKYSYCQNQIGVTPFSTNTNTGGYGNVTYQWYENTIKSTVGSTKATGLSTNSSYTPSTNTIGVRFYFVVIKNNLSSNSACDSFVSGLTDSIIVFSRPSINSVTNGNTNYKYCQNSLATSLIANASLTGGVTPNFTWYRSTSNMLPRTVNPLDSVGNMATYTPPTSSVGKTYYYVVIRNPNLNDPQCDTSSSPYSGSIEVYDTPSISQQPLKTSFEYCQGQTSGVTNLSVVASIGGYGVPQYQWYRNSVRSNSGGGLIPGATNTQITPKTDTAFYNPLYYYVKVSNGSGLMGCDSVISDTSGSIIIYQTPVIDYGASNLNNANYCKGEPRSVLSVVSTNIFANTIYQWYISENMGSIGNAIQNTDTNRYLPDDTTATRYYTVTIQRGNCTITSNVSPQITIFANPVILTQPAKTSQNLCLGSVASTLNVVAQAANGTSNLTYQWYRNNMPNSYTGVAIATATSSSFIPSDTVGDFYYYVQVGNNNIGGNNCKIISDTGGKITKIVSAVINYNNSDTASKTTCYRSNTITPFILSVNNGGLGTLNYKWFIQTTAINTGGVLIPNSNSNSFVPLDTLVGVRYYYAVIENTASSIGSSCREITSRVMGSITVYNTPSVDSPRTNVTMYCENTSIIAEPLTVNANNNGIGIISYQWYSNSSPTVIGGTKISNAISNSYIPPVNLAGTTYYYVIVKNLNAPTRCDSVFSAFSKPIVVNRSITISQQPGLNAVQYCLNSPSSPLTVTAASNDGYTPLRFQWYESSNPGNLGTLLLNDTLINYAPSTNVIGTKYYTVRISNANCSVFSNQSAAVETQNIPNIVFQPSTNPQSVCLNISTPTLNIIANDPLGTRNLFYKWYRNSIPSTLNAVALNNANDSFYIVNDSVGLKYYFVVVSSSLVGNVCAVTSNLSGGISVYDRPIIRSQNNRNIDYCYAVNQLGDSLTLMTTPGLLGSVQYQWVVNRTGVNVSGQNLGTDSIQRVIIDSVGRSYYYVILFNNNAPMSCRTTTSNILGDIEVYKSPLFDSITSSRSIYCENEAQNLVVPLMAYGKNAGYGTLSYQWYQNSVNNTIGGTPISLVSLNNNFTPIINFITTQYFYVVIRNGGVKGCDSIVATQPFAININRRPYITDSMLATATYCKDANPTNLSVTAVSNNGNNNSFAWYASSVTNVIGTPIVGAIFPTYTPSTATPDNTITTTYYQVIVNNGMCSTTSSQSGKIIINPLPNITTQPSGGLSYCENSTRMPISVRATSGNGLNNLNYNWYYNTINSYNGAIEILNSNDSNLIPKDTVGLVYYFAQINNAFSGNNCSIRTAISNPITIYDAPIVIQQPNTTNYRYCYSTTELADSTYRVSFNQRFSSSRIKWLRNSVGSILSGDSIYGNSTTFRPTLDSNGIFYYFAVAVNDAAPINSSCSTSTSAISGSVSVYIKPTVTNPTTITSQYCFNPANNGQENITVMGNQGRIGNIIYRWYLSPNNLTNNPAAQMVPSNQTNIYKPRIDTVGTFYYFVVAKNNSGLAACDSVVSNLAQRIDVGAAPTINLAQSNFIAGTYCKNDLVTPLRVSAKSNNTNAVIIQWYRNTSQSYNGAVAISGATDTFYIPPSVSATSFPLYYFVTINNGNCSFSSQISSAFIVNELPIISVQPNISGPQSVCFKFGATQLNISATSGVNDNNISYRWFINSDPNNQTGLVIPGAIANIFVPFDTIEGRRYYYVEVTNTQGNSCKITSTISAAIDVYTAPDITNMLSPITNKKYCKGLPNQTASDTLKILARTPVLGSLNYAWIRNSVANTLVGDSVGTGVVYNPKIDTQGRNYYYVRITNRSAPNACMVSTSGLSGSFEVYATPVISSVSSNLTTYCTNSTNLLQPIIASATNGGYGNLRTQWYVNSSDVRDASGNVISNANGLSFVPPIFNPGTFYYYILASNGSGLVCDSIFSSISVRVDVNPLPTIQSFIIDTNASFYCTNVPATALSINAVSNNLNPLTYQWYSNTNRDTSIVTRMLINSAIGFSFTPPSTISGSLQYYFCKISNGFCNINSVVSGAVNIVERPTIVGENLFIPNGIYQCKDTTSPILSVANNPILKFQWYDSTTQRGAWLPVNNDTLNTINASTSEAGLKYYRVIATAVGTTGCNATSNTSGVIRILPNIVFDNFNVVTGKFCLNNATRNMTVIGNTNSLGNLRYVWYRQNTNMNSGGDSVAENSTFRPIATHVGKNYYYVVAINVDAPINGRCYAATSAIAGNFDVYTYPIVSNLFTSQATYCQNLSLPQDMIVTGTTGGYGTLSFQWYSNLTNDTFSGSRINGANLQRYQPPINNIGTIYYYVVLSNGSGLACDSIVSDTTIAITINIPPTIINQPNTNTATICLNGISPTYTVGANSNSISPLSYQWYSNNTRSATTISGIGLPVTNNGTSQMFRPDSTVATDSTFFRVVVGNVSCFVTSNVTGRFIVYNPPIITGTSLNPAFYCVRQTQNISNLSVTATDIRGGTNLRYTWYFNSVPTKTGATQIVNGTSTNAPNLNNSGVYYYILDVANNVTTPGFPLNNCVTTLVSGAVTVYNQPVINNIKTQAKQYCFNQSNVDSLQIEAIPTGNETYTYTWYRSDVNNFSKTPELLMNQTRSTIIPQVNQTGRFYYVTIVSNNSIANGLACKSDTSDFTGAIETYNNPVFNTISISKDSYCIGGSVDTIKVISANNGGWGTLSYEWFYNFNNNSLIGGTKVGLNSPTYIPNNLAPIGVYYYYLILHNGGPKACDSVSSVLPLQINVERPPQITMQPSRTLKRLCFGTNADTLFIVANTAGIQGNLLYQWYASKSVSKTNPVTVGDPTSNPFLVTPTSRYDTNYYFVRVINQGVLSVNCQSTESDPSGQIIVISAPTVSNRYDSFIYCRNTLPATINLQYTAGQGSSISAFEWYFNPVQSNLNGFRINVPASSTSISPNTDTIGIKYYYVKIINSNSCFVISPIITKITINSRPEVTFQPTLNSTNSFYCRTLGGLGGTINVNAVATGQGEPNFGNNILRFDWFKKALNNNFNEGNFVTTTTSLSGTASSYTVPLSFPDTAYYFVSIVNANNCSTVTNFTVNNIGQVARIEIADNPVISNITLPGSRRYCFSNSLKSRTISIMPNTTIYNIKWFKTIEANGVNASVIPNANTTFYIPDINTMGYYYYYLTYNYGSAVCSDSTPILAGDSIYNNIVLTQTNLASAKYCNTSASTNALNVSATNGGLGTLKYQWFINTSAVADTTDPSKQVGSNNYLLNPFLSLIGKNYYYVLVNNIDAPQGTCKNAISNVSGAIEVYGRPSIQLSSTSLADRIYCRNDTNAVLSFEITSDFGGYGVVKYQWYKSSLPSTSLGTPVANANNILFKPFVNNLDTNYYYALITNGSGIKLCDSVYSEISGKIVVITAPVFLTQNLSNRSYCFNFENPYAGVINLTVTTDFATSFQWYLSRVSNDIGDPIAGETNLNYPPKVDVAGIFYYRIVASNSSCNTTSMISKIIVNELPTIVSMERKPEISNLRLLLCQFDSLNAPNITISALDYLGGTKLNYKWYRVNQQQYVNFFEVGNDTNSIYADTKNSGSYYYFAVAYNNYPDNTCSATSDFSGQTVNINQNPIITSPLNSNDRAVCQNDPNPSPLVIQATAGQDNSIDEYRWFYSTTNTNVNNLTFLPLPTPSNSILPPTNLPGNSFRYYLVVLRDNNNCTTTSQFSGKVTVSFVPIIDQNLTTTNTTNGILCLNYNPDTLKLQAHLNSGDNPNYQWLAAKTMIPTDARVIAGVPSLNSFVIPTTMVDTNYYYGVVIDPVSACKTTSSISELYVVNKLPAIFQNPSTKSLVLCQQQLDTNSYFITIENPNYQVEWYRSFIQGSFNGTAIPNSNTLVFRPLTDIISNAFYYAIVTDFTGCRSTSSQSGSVSVRGVPIILNPAQLDTTKTCIGNIANSINLLVTPPAGSDISGYQWIRVKNNLGFLTTDTLVGATNVSYTPIISTEGLYEYRALVSSNNGCVVSSPTLRRYNINPNPIIPNLSSDNLRLELCRFATNTKELFIDPSVGALNLQWYRSKTNYYPNVQNNMFFAVTGATNTFYTPTTNDTGSNYYFLVASTQFNCRATSNPSGDFYIIPTPIVTQLALSATSFCFSDPNATILVRANSGINPADTLNLTYQWYTTLVPGANSGGEAIVDGNRGKSNLLRLVNSMASALYYYVEITNSLGCANVSQATPLVEIVDTPRFIDNTYNLSNISYSLCQNTTNPNFLIVNASAGSGAGSLNPVWYRATTASYSGVVVSNQGSFYAPSTTEAGEFYYYVIFTQSKGSCKLSSTISGKIDVLARPTIVLNLNPGDISEVSYCAGTATDPLRVTTSGSNVNYLWYMSPTKNIRDTVLIPNETMSSYTPNNTTIGSRYYLVKVLNNALGCATLSDFSEKINILSSPLLTTSTNFNNAVQYCANRTATNPLTIAVTDVPNTIISYRWFILNKDDTNTLIALATEDTLNTYLPNYKIPGDYYFRAIVSNASSLASCRTSTSALSGIYTVNDTPSILSLSFAQGAPDRNYCSNNQIIQSIFVNVNRSPNNQNLDFTWYQIPDGGTTNDGYEVFSGINLDTIYPLSNQIGASRYFTIINNANNCFTTSDVSGVVRINSAPQIVTNINNSDYSYCLNASNVRPLTISSPSMSLVYEWFKYDITTRNTSTLPSTSNSYKPINIDTASRYFARITSGIGCVIMTDTSGVYRFLPEPQLPAADITFISNCLGQPITQQLSITGLTGGIGTPRYSWYKSRLADRNSGYIISNSQTYVPLSDTVGSFYYYGVASFDTIYGCAVVKTQNTQLTTNSLPNLSANFPSKTTKNYCLGDTIIPLKINILNKTNVTYSYRWFRTQNPVNNNGTELLNEIDSQYTPPNNIISNFYYYAIVGNDFCLATSTISGINNINALPVITSQPNKRDTIYVQFSTPARLAVTVASTPVPASTANWYTTTDTFVLGSLAATGLNFLPSTSQISSSYYRSIVIGNNGCRATSNASGRITVIANMRIVGQPSVSPATYCQYSSNVTNISVNIDPGSTQITRYTWYYTLNISQKGDSIPNSNSNTIAPLTNLAPGTYYYYVVVTNNFSQTVTSNLSGGITLTAKAIVVNSGLIDSSYCTSTRDYLNFSLSGGSGVPYIIWYVSTFNNYNPITSTQLSTNTNLSQSLEILKTQSGNFYYYARINYPNEPNPECQNIYTKIVNIKVYDNIAISKDLTPLYNYCQGQDAEQLNVVATTPYSNFAMNQVRYEWYAITTEAGRDIIQKLPDTTNYYTPSTAIPGIFKYYAKIYNGAPLVASCAVRNSITTTITINVSPVITIQPIEENKFGLNELATNLVVTSPTSNITYTWFSNTINSTEGGTRILNQTNYYFNPPTTDTGTLYYYVRLSYIDPRTSPNCNNTLSNVSSVKITLKPQIISVSYIDTGYCLSSPAAPIVINAFDGGSRLKYNWYSSAFPTFDNPVFVVSDTLNYYTPSTSLPGTLYFFCVIDNGGAPLYSKDTSDFIRVYVDDNSSFDISLVSDTINYCKNQESIPKFKILTFDDTYTYSYQWFSSDQDGQNPITRTLLDTFTTFMPTDTLYGPNYYYVVVNNHLNGGSANCNTATSKIATAFIWSKPIINLDLKDSIYCTGNIVQPLIFSAVSNYSDLTNTWFKSSTYLRQDDAVIPNVSGETYMPLLPFDSVFITARISNKSPIAECQYIETKTARVIITPTPTLPYSDTFQICSGTNFYLILTPNTKNTSISWKRPTSQGVNNEANSGTGLISETLYNTYTQPNTAYTKYTINLVTNIGCKNVNYLNLAIKPTPIITDITGGRTAIYCSQIGTFNNSRPKSIISVNYPNAKVSWFIRYPNQTAPITTRGDTNVIPAFSVRNPTAFNDILYNAIVISANLNDCISPIDSVSFSIAPPIPHQVVVGNEVVCKGFQPTSLFSTNRDISVPPPPVYSSYRWQYSDTNTPASFYITPLTGITAFTRELIPPKQFVPKFYRVITQYGCVDTSDILKVDTLPIPVVKIIYTRQPIVSFGNPFVINVSGAQNFAWSPIISAKEFYNAATNQIILYPQSSLLLDSIYTKYYITGTNANQCKNTDSISILSTRGYDLGPSVSSGVTVVTPNGDGVNDVLMFNNLSYYTFSHIYIYNSFNQLVYESIDYQKNNNFFTGVGNVGKYENVKLNTGTYYFKVIFGKIEDVETPSKLITLYSTFSIVNQ